MRRSRAPRLSLAVPGKILVVRTARWIPAALILAATPVWPADCAGIGERGRSLLQQKQPEQAAAEFRRALAGCPEQRILLLELARALTAERKFTEAVDAAREFLGVQPGSEAGLLVLANTHFMALEFPRCLEVVERLLTANPRHRAALTMKANAQYLGGDEAAAEQTFLALIELDPNSEESNYSLGRIYYQQNRFQPALARFQRVLQLNPLSFKAYDNLGLCHEALSQDDQAIRHYLKALELVHKDHRDYDWAYGNLANLMLKRGEDEKAFQLAAEAADRNPASARNFFLGGKALGRLDKLDLAIKWLRQSAELDPGYAEPRYLLGQMYQRLGRKAEAEQELKTFEEIQARQPRRRR